jgi:hypothetical protein
MAFLLHAKSIFLLLKIIKEVGVIGAENQAISLLKTRFKA